MRLFDFVESEALPALLISPSISTPPGFTATSIPTKAFRPSRGYVRAHLDPPAAKRLEMTQLDQRPVNPRRRNLERVAPLDRVVNVQQVAHRPGLSPLDRRGLFRPPADPRTGAAASARALFILDRHQFEPLPLDMWLEQLDDLFATGFSCNTITGRSIVARLADQALSPVPSKAADKPTKKWASAHFIGDYHRRRRASSRGADRMRDRQVCRGGFARPLKPSLAQAPTAPSPSRSMRDR